MEWIRDCCWVYINNKKCSYDQQTHYRIGERPMPYVTYKKYDS